MAAQKVAVFIDAENVTVAAADRIIEEAGRHGVVRERRLYGDFIRRSQLSSWMEAAPRHALTPRQTAGGTAGKNGADIALVIDAMEVLCRGEADVFCIATGDGDFTQLAMRIRQEGKTVVGLGGDAASHHFKQACDSFVEVVKAAPVVAAPQGNAPGPRKLDAGLLKRAFVAAPRLDGEDWIRLSDVKKALKDCVPTFDVKAYGHSQLYKLLAFSGVELADKNRKARIGGKVQQRPAKKSQPSLPAHLN